MSIFRGFSREYREVTLITAFISHLVLVPLCGERVEHLSGAVDLSADEEGHRQVVREQRPGGYQLGGGRRVT